MNYPYTINDLASNCKVSTQSIYNLIRKNQAFINDNSVRRQRKIYYNQTAMDFFLSYYGKATTESSVEEKKSAEIPRPEGEQSPAESSSVDDPAASRIKALESELEAKEAEIKRLNDLLAAKETERIELLNQNGALILTLQQEKQEKMLLLPAPRKPFKERFKSIFKSSDR